MAGRVIGSETDTGDEGDVRFTRFCGLPDEDFRGLDMIVYIVDLEKKIQNNISITQFNMSEEAAPDRVKLKKWNAVALWAYDTTGGNSGDRFGLNNIFIFIIRIHLFLFFS